MEDLPIPRANAHSGITPQQYKCPYCSVNGIQYTCTVCSGRLYYEIVYVNPCPACNGHKFIDNDVLCTRCLGRGNDETSPYGIWEQSRYKRKRDESD